MKEENTCKLCKDNLPFELPSEIIESAIKGKLILFVGSGVSTESRKVFPYTLYEDIASEMKIDSNSLNLTFSELMSKYCKKPNGKKELLKKIKYRLDYIKSFQELYDTATMFHRELSSMYMIKEIFTTNWDDYFEVECGAIPFVTMEDIAFWDIPSRKVFKIHGSINNVGSIVATKEDYEKCYKRLKKEFIGDYLRVTLSTKLVVFIGYSFQDEDFYKIYSLLKKSLGELMPNSYLVTLDENIFNNFDSSLITPIITDGAYFIHTLRSELEKEEVLLGDEIGVFAEMILKNIQKIHYIDMNKIKIIEYPDAVYTYCYQDGVIHALQRFETLKCTGEYHHICIYKELFKLYEEIRKNKVRSKRYDDVAYIDGYLNGLTVLLTDNIEEINNFPYYYLYGMKEEIKDFTEYKSIVKRDKIFHKGASEYAKKLIFRMKTKKDMVYHHTAFLL